MSFTAHYIILNIRLPEKSASFHSMIKNENMVLFKEKEMQCLLSDYSGNDQ